MFPLILCGIIIIISAKESVYLGSIKYQLFPGQNFEHQFFDIKAIKSMDLYYPDPPYRKVDDSFMECYWSYQQMGLQEYTALNMSVGNSFDSDLICLDQCYFRQGSQLMIENGKIVELGQTNFHLLSLSSIGQLIFYNEKSVAVFDTVVEEISEFNSEFTQILKKCRFGIEHFNTQLVYICSEEGVRGYTNQFEIINNLRNEQNQSINCQKLLLQDDYLFVISEGVNVFDINDPINPQLLMTLDLKADYYDLYKQTFAMLVQEEQRFMIKVFNYQVQIQQVELVNFTITLEGVVPNDFQASELQFTLLNEQVAVISSKGTVTLISLQTTLHQKLRHNSTLVFSEHILSPDNQIFTFNQKIVQADQKLHFYNLTNQIYNLVCTAPDEAQRFILYGLIRSEEQCEVPPIDEKFKPILDQENDNDVKCIYTFQLNLSINDPPHKWSDSSILLLGVFILLFLILLVQHYRNNQKNFTINNLKKFEQLNRMNLQKEKIRITHDDEEGNAQPKFDNDLL